MNNGNQAKRNNNIGGVFTGHDTSAHAVIVDNDLPLMKEHHPDELTLEQIAAMIQGSCDGDPTTPTSIEADSILDRHKVHDGLPYTALSQTIERYQN